MSRIPFSNKPGRHERHFQCKINNELFDDPITAYTDEDLLEVQRLDHEELLAFLTELREVVQQAVNLKPNEESDVVLKLKERLDKLYETAAGLADQQAANKDALHKLVLAIMGTIKQGALGDPMAENELQQEELARNTHYALLEHPIVADLLHPESVIQQHELVAVLLSQSEDDLAAAMQLFDAAQLALIYEQARALLQQRDPQGQRLPKAAERLKQIQSGLIQI